MAFTFLSFMLWISPNIHSVCGVSRAPPARLSQNHRAHGLSIYYHGREELGVAEWLKCKMKASRRT